MSMHYPLNIREEELKKLVANDYFSQYDTTPVLGEIDFCVAKHRGDNQNQTYLFYENERNFEIQSFLWAESKRGNKADIYKSFVQLILTIGRKRTFETYLPPLFLGAFDAEKIAFIEYDAISEIFVQNDFNWNVTPSNYETKEFEQLNTLVIETLKEKNTLFYFNDDEANLKKFIKMNFVAGRSNTKKISVTKTNFTTVYLHWLKIVKPTIDIDWDKAKKFGVIDADFYLADLLSRDNESLIKSLFVLLNNDRYSIIKGKSELGLDSSDTVNFKDKQEKHREFWNRYERPPRKEFWNYIIERRDLLVPQDIRERKGSYFTPQIWVEKSQEYLTKALGDDWQDEYYIWDCCAGTGNLEVGLVNKYNIFASTLDKADVDVMKELAQTNGNLLENHIFQFDFLNDEFNSDKVPEDLKKILNNPEKREKLVIYINPPYKEASSRKAQAGKKEAHSPGVAVSTKVYADYASKVKKGALRELFCQFFIRICQNLPEARLATFSTLKYINAPNFAEFKQIFTGKYLGGFICPSTTFDNVKGHFPIGFLIWDLNVKQMVQSVVVDVLDSDGNIVGNKKFFSIEKGKYMIDWFRVYTQRKKNELGSLRMQGNDLQQQNNIAISSKPTENDLKKDVFTYITQDNLIPVSIYYAVKHCVKSTWINNRDQFLFPDVPKIENDTMFQSDCLIYTIFDSDIKSALGIANHWIPFTEEEVGARGLFDSHFMHDFLNGKIKKQTDGILATGETYKFIFSDEAQEVLNRAKELYKYYHARENSNPNASFYDIREYFQERNEKGKMNNSSQDEKYNSLIATLRQAHTKLAKKIEPKVYEYGFLIG